MNNHDFLIAIGNNIREHRRLQKFTKDRLAELCGLSIPAITSIELGKRPTDVANINRIANALNIQPYELLIFNKGQLTPTVQHITVDGTKPIQINLSIQITPP